MRITVLAALRIIVAVIIAVLIFKTLFRMPDQGLQQNPAR